MTEGATIEITLGDITRVSVVVTDPSVVVNKSVRKPRHGQPGRAAGRRASPPRASLPKPSRAARKPQAAKVTAASAARAGQVGETRGIFRTAGTCR